MFDEYSGIGDVRPAITREFSTEIVATILAAGGQKRPGSQKRILPRIAHGENLLHDFLMFRLPHWFCICVAFFAVGCDESGDDEPPTIESRRPIVDHGPGPEASEDPLGARLHAFGQEELSRHEPEGTMIRGELSRGQVEDFPLVFLGTHCYAVLGMGGEGVEELDLILMDSAGNASMTDTREGNTASLGIGQAICPMNAGQYKVRVRVFAGEGPYAVQVYKYQVL